jgi:hypothetical protein
MRFPNGERLHILRRTVSHHRTAAHCSVGSFSGYSKPREPSLKSAHDPNLAWFLLEPGRGRIVDPIVL